MKVDRASEEETTTTVEPRQHAGRHGNHHRGRHQDSDETKTSAEQREQERNSNREIRHRQREQERLRETQHEMSMAESLRGAQPGVNHNLTGEAEGRWVETPTPVKGMTPTRHGVRGHVHNTDDEDLVGGSGNEVSSEEEDSSEETDGNTDDESKQVNDLDILGYFRGMNVLISHSHCGPWY